MTTPSSNLPSTLPTLVDFLRWRSQYQGDRLLYSFLTDGEVAEHQLTHRSLDLKARTIAAHLQERTRPGDRALLLYPASLDYIVAFFGCLYAGVVPVPAYPPRRNRSLERIDRIVSDAEATIMMTTASALGDIERRFKEDPELRNMAMLASDEMDEAAADAWTPFSPGPDDLAFLQYTSGSTGIPKGVMVSHGNLLHNERMMQNAFQTNENAVGVAWLPMYHDMGLIGNVLQPLYTGFHFYFMAPVAFLQKPYRWLRAITDHKATITGGPNFAYDLCVRKISPEQRETLDLSSLEIAYNGSEPVHKETLDRFAETFAPYGFRKEAFYPCYGLAEATLFVTGERKAEAPLVERVEEEALSQNRVVPVNGHPGPARDLVSCGHSWLEQKIEIVDPDSFTLAQPGRIGEIWISGPSVALGYWNRPEDTNVTFRARLRDHKNGYCLRTGDLGFLKDGRLFVTGRLKDLIIIRGRNHYPQDIERTIEKTHPALREGAGAAFAIEVDGEEKLAVVQEVERSYLRDLDVDGVAAAMRRAVSEEHELQIHTVILLKTHSIPKTSSGKIQRHACREGWLDGTLDVVAASTFDHADAGSESDGAFDTTALDAVPPEERAPIYGFLLQQLVAQVLKMRASDIDRAHPLGDLGLDSLDMVELKSQIESRLHVVVPTDEALNELSIDQIAAKLGRGARNEPPADEPLDGETRPPTDLFAKCATDGGYFGKYRVQKDSYFTQPILEGVPGPRMTFQGRDVIVWSINNYLGIIGHERVQAQARETLDTYGIWSPMGSRMLTGNTARHVELEARLAAYLHKPASIVFNYGYMGVMGTMSSLVDGNDTVIIDSLSHACIVDGAMVAAAGKPFRVFRHNDVQSLEDQLKAANRNRKGGVLVVTEGVFGMSGDIAPLREICAVKDRYGARLFVDDAHGFGVMGATGAGIGEHLGVQDRIDLYFGTFAKSFAAIGGVTAGDEAVIDYIRYNARPHIFAKSLPLVYVESVMTALDLIHHEPERRHQMWHIARRLQKGLVDLGFDIGNTESPITPVYVPAGDEETATEAMHLLRTEYGIFVSAVTYPVVPRGVVLFRMTSTAAHTDEDVDRTLDAFKKLRNHLNLKAARRNPAPIGDLVKPTV